MFKSASSQLNLEFDRVHRGEKAGRKRNRHGSHTLLVPALAVAGAVGGGADGGVAVGEMTATAVGSSDDEANADVEELAEEQGVTDEDDDDDEDNASLASFVVSDSHVSDAGVLEQDSSDGQGESDVSGGEDDSESGSSDDDSDEEYVPPEKDHRGDTRMEPSEQ